MTNETNTAPNNGQNNVRNILLFVSGIGILAAVVAFLLFGNSVLGSQTDPAADNVSISDFPEVTPVVNRIVEDVDLAGAIAVGNVAPNFTLTDINGNSHNLSDLRGKPVIVNFWATWCAPCRFEMPELEETFQDYAADDLVILALNREESSEVVESFFVEEFDLSFTALLDSQAEVAEAYGVFNMPTTYFINGEGEVTAVHRGPLVRSQIDGYLEATIQ